MLDEDRDLYTKLNKSMVLIQEVTDKYDVLELKGMIEDHVAYTNSEKGKEIQDELWRVSAQVQEDYSAGLSSGC